MKKLLIILLSALCILSLMGCENDGGNEGFSIVVTAFPHYDIARELTKGIDGISIKMLISPGSEVHHYDPTPKDILAISECDAFIYTGGESESWVTDIINDSGNKSMKKVSFSRIFEHHDEETELHVHDEHYWTSIKKTMLAAEETAKALCKAMPQSEDKIKENLDDYLTRLSEVDALFEDAVSQKKRDFIVVGDRFPFYHMALDYGFDYVSPYSGCSSSTEPSAKAVAQIAQAVKDENVKYVFVIEFSNGKIADSIIDNSGAKKLLLHSCHNVSKDEFESGVSYIDLMKANAQNLRKALCE